MAQHDMVIDNAPGLGVRTDMNAAILALVTFSSGPVEPAVMYAGQMWLDTSVVPNGLLRQRDQANASWIIPPVSPTDLSNYVRVDAAQAFSAAQKLRGQQNLDTNRITFQAKAGAYTAGIGDSGTTLVFSAAAVLSLDAAATLRSGWWIKVIPPAAGILTVDPNGAELIDGVATKSVRGTPFTIFCDGGRFVTDLPARGWEMIQIAAPAASNAIAFTDLADYRKVRLSGMVIGSADGIGQINVSTNNGASYLTGASDYTLEYHYGTSSNSQVSGAANAGVISQPVTTALAGQAWIFEQEFNNFNQATVSRGFSRSNVVAAAAGPHYMSHGANWCNGVAARNAVKLQLSAGVFATGTILYLEGIRG